VNAYEVKALREMGIDPAKLGCVMLDVEPIDVTTILPPEWAYVSTNPDHWWIKGYGVTSHVTLLYGLLENANKIKAAVDEVLTGWEQPGLIWIDDIGHFPSTFDDEPYSCLIGRVFVSDALRDAHARLSYLPHIDTFWDYKPHVTLAYVGTEFTEEASGMLRHGLASFRLAPRGLNYGRQGDG
jgi:hypothetical protein